MSETPTTTPQGSGLAPNVAGALAYVLSPISGILFFVIDKESRFVRFHAAQSIGFGVAMFVLWIAVTILSTVLAFIPFVGWMIGSLLSLALAAASFGLWLYLMYQAYQGQEWEVPVLGAQVRRHLPAAAPARPE